ncbi:MAG: hypothetical protein PVJ28_06645 [Acidimicrobiia bacterium]|jgi:hypothetical protein
MAKATYSGPAHRLELYGELVASVEGVERKGAANPYTSRNGHMTSFIDKAGEVSIRLDEEDREEFLEKYDSRIPVQYGSQMKEFVVVPDDLLERQDEVRSWFVKSWDWVGTLEPK